LTIQDTKQQQIFGILNMTKWLEYIQQSHFKTIQYTP